MQYQATSQQLVDFFKASSVSTSTLTGTSKVITGISLSRNNFTCTYDTGLITYSFDALSISECIRMDKELEMDFAVQLEDSDLVIVVSGNQVLLWLDGQRKWVGGLKVSQKIVSVKVKRDLLLVVCTNKSLWYSFPSLEKIGEFATCLNEGVGVLNENDLVLMGNRAGVLCFKSLGQYQDQLIPVFPSNCTIRCVEISLDGTHVAVADTVGKEIKVFEKSGRKPTQKKLLWRGNTSAIIKSMSFSKNNEYLAVTSESSTVHIFKIAQPGVKSFGWSLLSYNQEYSFVQIATEPDSIVTFTEDPHVILILGKDGIARYYSFNDEGEEIRSNEQHTFLSDFM